MKHKAENKLITIGGNSRLKMYVRVHVRFRYSRTLYMAKNLII